MFTFLKSKFSQSFVNRWQCYPLDHMFHDNRIHGDNQLKKETVTENFI